MIIKDEGHGITEKSLEFWQVSKHRLGNILAVVVTAKPLLVEQRKDCGITYDVEYNFTAQGTAGVIYLSGCNCGYGGEGPNGTAKILAELGLPFVAARAAVLSQKVEFDLQTDTLLVDGKKYEFPMSDLRREVSSYDDLLYEIEYERGMEVKREMRNARRGDDGEDDDGEYY